MTEGPISAGTLTVRIVSEAGNLNRDVKRKVDDAAAGAQAGLTGADRNIGDKARSIGNRASLFLTLPLLAAGKAAIDASSDVVESTNKVNVVFGSAGARVVKWSDGTAAAFGVSKRAALDYAGVFGSLLRPMGLTERQSAKMSTHLVKLAGDMASFSNADPEQVLEALRSGMVGETEPLRRFGVNLNQARVEAEAMRLGLVKTAKDAGAIRIAAQRNTLAQAAYTKAVKEHGKTSDEAKRAALTQESAQRALAKAVKGQIPPLTGAQKAQATYSLIMQDSKLQQGDFQRSLSTSAANQARVNKALADNAQAAIGGQLLPLWQKALVGIGKLAHGFSTLGPTGQKAVLVLVGVAAALGPVLRLSANVATASTKVASGVTKVAGAGSQLVGGFRNVNAAYSDNASLATRVGAGVRSQLSAWAQQAKALATNAAAQARATAATLRDAAVRTGEQAKAMALSAAAWLRDTAVQARNLAVSVAQRAALLAQAAAQRVVMLATKAWAAAQWLINAAMSANPIGLVIAAIALLAAGVVVAWKRSETFRNIVMGAWDAIKGATGNMVALMVNGFHVLADVWLTVVGTIVHGAAAALGWVPGVGGKLKKASAAFDGFKRSVDSKLSAIAASADKWGTDTGDGFAAGLHASVPHVTTRARELARAAHMSMTNYLRTASPSKLMRDVGRYVGQGLEQGLLDGVAGVRRASTELASHLHQALADKAVSKADVAAIVARFGQVKAHLIDLARNHDRVVASLGKARQALKELRTEAGNYAAGIADAVRATGDLTSVGGDDPTAGSIVTGLQAAVDKARTFRDNLRTLAARGLSKAATDELYSKGVEGGSAAAAALAAGTDAQLKQANKLQATLAGLATTVGEDARKRMYGAGIQAAEGVVAGLESKEKRLRRAMTKLADALVDAIKRRLGIHSPARVLELQGRMAGEGLALGARRQERHVAAAGRRLADAIVQPVRPYAMARPAAGMAGAGVMELPAGAVRGGDGAVAVNVHPAPGMDEETIGRVAARELEWQLR